MAQIIAGLGAQLGLDTTEFQKGIGEAKKGLKEFAEYLPEALSVAAFVEMTKASIEMADRIYEIAKANEVSISSVLELSKALEENGGEAENTSRIYSGFTQKLESAAQGNAKAQTSFERLGISLNDLKTLSEQDLFEKTVTGLAHMKDAAERNGLAYQTLGKAIRGVDIKGLSESLEEGKGSLDKFASAIEQGREMSLRHKETMHLLSMEFTNSVIPSLNQLFASFKGGGEIAKVFFDILKYGMEGVVILVKTLTTGVAQVYHALETIGNYLVKIATFKWSTANEEWAKGWEKIKGDSKEYIEFLQKVIEVNSDAAKPKLPNASNVVHREVTDALQKQITAAEQLSKTYESQAKAHLLALESQLNANEATKQQKQLQDELMKVVIERNKVLDEIDKREASVDKTVAGHQRIIAALEKQKQAVQDTYATIIQETEKAVLANQKLQESFGYGWDQAFKQFKENATTQADAGRTAFNSIVSSMDTALSNFVKTGKLNFKDLAGSIIQDLIRVQLKMQATSLFSQAGSMMGLGNLFGGSTAIGAAGGGGDAATLKLFGFADGGEPPVGVPSLVGERGPEIFVPKTAGTVIPNNMLGGGQSQQPSITYNGPYIASMQAIDTQSATQFLAKNKSAVWSANQSAQRSLPQSR